MGAIASNRSFARALTALLLFYLGLEAVYIIRFPLVMDEFGGAGLLYRMRQLVPYRDYPPYKTVLGYYIQLPLIFLPLKTWTVLVLIKLEMAVLTAALLGYAVWLLRDLFDRRALLAALALLITMSTFLERSPELRVDAMTGLAGLLSLVFLVRKQPIASGVMAAISFLISQKGAFFVVATGAALLYLLIIDRERRRHTWRFAITWGFAALAVLAAYVAFWSLIAGFGAVFRSTFQSAAQVATMTEYSDIRLRYWAQTLIRNPLFYGSFVASIVWLGWRGLRRSDENENLLAAYGAVIALQAALHQQPWPYFFVVVLPVALVVFACAGDRFLRSAVFQRHRTVFLFLYVAGGIVLPLTRLPVTLRRDSSFQKRNVDVAECILQPGDRYLAAVDVLFRNPQSVDELLWVDRTTLPGLYRMPPAAMNSLIRRIHATPTKLVLDNYRIAALPPPLRLYLRTEFEQLWGNIFIYAPRIAPGVFDVKFDGTYRIESADPSIILDGHTLPAGSLTELKRGAHRYEGRRVARIKLESRCVPSRPEPPGDFFPDVYDF